MYVEDKQSLEGQMYWRRWSIRLHTGCINMIESWLLIPVLLGYFVGACVIWNYRYAPFKTDITSIPVFAFISDVYAIIAILLFLLIIVIAFSKPIKAKRIEKAFIRAGITSSTRDAPILVNIYPHKDKLKTKTYIFEAHGIPLEVFTDKKARVENALNIWVKKISYGKNMCEIVITGIDGRYRYPDVMKWDDAFLSEWKYELLIGESFGSKVYISLKATPHILIGGATGSGKTILLKALLLQCVNNNHDVIIVDFKGGIDYPRFWKESCAFVVEESAFLESVSQIANCELKKRIELLSEEACSNIDEYNKRHEKKLHRIVIAIDELAEVLDKTGASKERKEVISKIEACLATIARLGRAPGIHLILATQRPDANILPGQIKNNIGYRFCGRADKVLSQIILDSTEAAEQIPVDSKGLFLTQDNMIFKGYMLDERY